jgi:hypothetical protein
VVEVNLLVSPAKDGPVKIGAGEGSACFDEKLGRDIEGAGGEFDSGLSGSLRDSFDEFFRGGDWSCEPQRGDHEDGEEIFHVLITVCWEVIFLFKNEEAESIGFVANHCGVAGGWATVDSVFRPNGATANRFVFPFNFPRSGSGFAEELVAVVEFYRGELEVFFGKRENMPYQGKYAGHSLRELTLNNYRGAHYK